MTEDPHLGLRFTAVVQFSLRDMQANFAKSITCSCFLQHLRKIQLCGSCRCQEPVPAAVAIFWGMIMQNCQKKSQAELLALTLPYSREMFDSLHQLCFSPPMRLITTNLCWKSFSLESDRRWQNQTTKYFLSHLLPCCAYYDFQVRGDCSRRVFLYGLILSAEYNALFILGQDTWDTRPRSTPRIRPETSNAKSISCRSSRWRGRSVRCTTNKSGGHTAETAPRDTHPWADNSTRSRYKFKKQNATRRDHNHSHKQAQCTWKQRRSRKQRLPLHQPTQAGGRREPGTEKLKIRSKERLKFIIQV